jgi:DNA-binding winged helix-turn-helix (wHTH) protein
MASGGFRFDRFSLDPADRQLKRGETPVELNARYLDALTLLVSEGGKLVTKDRFLDEVWRGVPVTDEALTQCIKTLRRQLGDDASRPRFIETVPKHGYRFIAPVEPLADEPEASLATTGAAATPPLLATPWRQFFLLGGAGTMGAGIAGILGGLFYGLVGASHAPQPGMGAVSVLLVLTSLTMVVALLGGGGVAFGIAAARLSQGRSLHWHILGGATGGLLVGGIVKLLGLDAFNLLFGQALGNITGALEGAALGAAIGLGAWLGSGTDSLRRAASSAAAAGGAAGLLIPLLGGRMMGGSLALLARTFPGSRLRMDQIGALFGEAGFGPISQSVTGALEGALFGGCVVGAMLLARRSLD